MNKKWVYKVNSHRPGKLTGWHFDQYFNYRGRKPQGMGGDGWILSPQSWQRLREVRKGDLFLCYQSDERRIYGLARAASDGYETLAGSGRFNRVDFAAGGLRLHEPLNLARPEQRAIFGHIRAFTVPSRGTIHALAADEFRAAMRELIAANPEQAAAIHAFLKG
jgi:hypothetical protein